MRATRAYPGEQADTWREMTGGIWNAGPTGLRCAVVDTCRLGLARCFLARLAALGLAWLNDGLMGFWAELGFSWAQLLGFA